jgi:hypothetical protein
MFEKLNSFKKNILFDCVLGLLLIVFIVVSFFGDYGDFKENSSFLTAIVITIFSLFCLHALFLLWLAYKNFVLKDNDKAIKFFALSVILLILFSKMLFHLGIVYATGYP